MLSRIKVILDWGRFAGWGAALAFAVYRIQMKMGLPQPATLTLKPRWAQHPVTMRLGDSSDMSVFRQIFWFNEYGCLRDIPAPRVILDLGANVGYSSAYFLSCFPTAKVVAVEPDPNNYKACCKNLAPYGDRVRVVAGAVWSRRAELALSRGTFGDGREWSSEVRERESSDSAAKVEGWDVPSLMELAGGGPVDLLKVDIEGSELSVFDAESAAWLPDVRNICIELHGDQCSEVFLGSLRSFQYDLSTSGELTVCRNLRPAGRG